MVLCYSYFTYISMEKFVKTLEASAVSGALISSSLPDKTVMENSETENELKDRLVSVSSRLF